MNDGDCVGVESNRSRGNLFGCRFCIVCRLRFEQNPEIFVAPDFEAVDRRMQRAGFRDPETWFIQQRDTLAFPIPHGGSPQHTKIMNVVWPITALYLPVLGWSLYADMARRKPMSMSTDTHATHGGRSFWKSVFVSTTHCAAGCVIGDIIGAPLVFWAGWTLFGSRLFAEFLVLFVLAYIFGIAFQYLPIRAMRRISWRERWSVRSPPPSKLSSADMV
jgi:hypothetical protein